MNEEQKVVELYQQDKTLKYIAKNVFGTQSIIRVVSILESREDSGYFPGRRRTRRSKYFYDENFFESIDTEEKAYFLGWIASDGWIKYINGNPYAVCLEILSSDEEVLLAWQKVMGERAPKIVHRENASGNAKSRIVFHSVKMCRDLEAIGLGKDKTHNLGDISSAIPANLMRHFVRGVFDGDGSATIEPRRLRLSFRGTETFLESLHRVIPEETHIVIGNQKWPSLMTNKHRSAIRLAYWMYHNASVLLSRKWIKCKSGFVLRRTKKTLNIGGSPGVGNAEGQAARQARNDYQRASL